MYQLISGTFRTPRGQPVSMHYRADTNDYNTIFASLSDDEYLLPHRLSGMALDIGGYVGSVAIGLAIDNPDLRVAIVEPVPPNVDLIKRNVAANGLSERIDILQGAVGAGGEPVEVWYGYRGSESLEHHAFVGNSTLAYESTPLEHETATYTAMSLASLVKAYGPVAFMKIDTEGAEWAFLDSPDIADVETIVGEWHPVRNHTMGDLLELLEPTHVVTFTGPQTGPGGFRAEKRAP